MGMALKEFLKHSKEARGVLGQASMQACRQVGKQSSKKANKQASQEMQIFVRSSVRVKLV